MVVARSELSLTGLIEFAQSPQKHSLQTRAVDYDQLATVSISIDDWYSATQTGNAMQGDSRGPSADWAKYSFDKDNERRLGD